MAFILYNRFTSTINPFPLDKILDQIKLKAFADDKLNETKMIISVFNRGENIVGKGEIACTSNFSFSHNVFKRLSFPDQSKGVVLWEWVSHFLKRQILDSSNLKEFANFRFDETDKKFSKRVENCVKRKNCSLQVISPFPTVFSKDSFCRHVKTMDCLGKD